MKILKRCKIFNQNNLAEMEGGGAMGQLNTKAENFPTRTYCKQNGGRLTREVSK